MTTQTIGTHSGKRDKRFAAEIYGFVREFQNIKEDKAERSYIIGRYLAFEQFWGSSSSVGQ